MLEQDAEQPAQNVSAAALQELFLSWHSLSEDEQAETFLRLDRTAAEELFLRVSPADQAALFALIPLYDRRTWLRLLPPDEAADLVQHLPEDEQPEALNLLDALTRTEVLGLMAYKEDQAGGLMSPRYVRLRPDMTVDQAIRYLREQTRSQVETIYYAYVLDQSQKLLGAVSLRQLFAATPDKKVSDIMTQGGRLIFVRENDEQEAIARVFSSKEHKVLPVLDDAGVMKGVVTVEDIVDVVQDEATEDMQKMGGMEALDEPYFKVGLLAMIRKRAGWLLALFIGEMLTATAMGHYEDEIAKAVVLALFLPLIISSGGNSGGQATTLIIRAMALGEVRPRDWGRVFAREALSGLALGAILGTVGLLRIMVWPQSETLYGVHYDLLAIAVGISLMGVVLWGTLIGSMLPMLLRRLGFDPAVASAPFVATLVDVTGIMLYFTAASIILRGVML